MSVLGAAAIGDGVPVGKLRRTAAVRLRAAGIEGGELDARVLLAHALGVDAADLLGVADDTIDRAAQARFLEAITRRAAGEPVARIVGTKEFWSREFGLSPDVLVPRPETEIVVEAALAATPERDAALRVLDLGVGSGALIAAILLERPRARGIGVDLSPGAIRVARKNLDALGVGARANLLCGDWGAALAGKFDLVVANPPYIASGEIVTLAREVREHDPRIALDGGPDGLAAYRMIVRDLPSLLAPGGVAVLELGNGQAEAVAAIARNAHLVVNETRRDLAGCPRALIVRVEQSKKPLGTGGEPH